MKKIDFVTSNKGKVWEARKLFEQVGISVIQNDIGYPEIQSKSLKEVASFGVEYISKKFSNAFFLEDAGLFIDSLNGFPGVYSAYVFYSIGLNGILKLLEGVSSDKRSARFQSVIAYKEPGEKTQFFIGECQGMLNDEAVGSNGFGYDPLFIPKGESKTFAQMQTEEKNRFSHRGKSLGKLKESLKK